MACNYWWSSQSGLFPEHPYCEKGIDNGTGSTAQNHHQGHCILRDALQIYQSHSILVVKILIEENLLSYYHELDMMHIFHVHHRILPNIYRIDIHHYSKYQDLPRPNDNLKYAKNQHHQ